ncbi:MAG: family 16 glycosylhydrolase [Anaerolineales bacterium]|nr:family 16 glycosylhydrolase [Anaerolineales bacterium]
MYNLTENRSPNSNIATRSNGWRFSIPAGNGTQYQLAQLDNYTGVARNKLPYRNPVKLRLRARVSENSLPGTWGFGFWNDPFGIGVGFGGRALRLPCLPNAVWFFHAARPNYLSLQNNCAGEGFLAMSIRSLHWPTLALSPLALLTPLLTMRRTSRWLRRQSRRIVQMDTESIDLDQTQWHTYQVDWQAMDVRLSVDDVPVLESTISPLGPLGLVLWIDNQYAAWRPDGSLGWGLAANPASWLEISDLHL